MLAARHGLRRFSFDSFWYAYERAGWPEPSADERWLLTPPAEQAAPHVPAHV